MHYEGRADWILVDWILVSCLKMAPAAEFGAYSWIIHPSEMVLTAEHKIQGALNLPVSTPWSLNSPISTPKPTHLHP